jgi:hypothetical protein
MGINHSLKPVMEDKDEGWKFQIMERVLEVCSPEYLYPYPVCQIWNNYFRIRYDKKNKQCCGSGSIFGHKDAFRIRIRIGLQRQTLDQDPEKMNTDPQH